MTNIIVTFGFSVRQFLTLFNSIFDSQHWGLQSKACRKCSIFTWIPLIFLILDRNSLSKSVWICERWLQTICRGLIGIRKEPKAEGLPIHPEGSCRNDWEICDLSISVEFFPFSCTLHGLCDCISIGCKVLKICEICYANSTCKCIYDISYTLLNVAF